MRIREFWIELLTRAATGSRKTRKLLTPVGLLVFGTFTAMFVLAGVSVDRLVGLSPLLPDRLAVPISLVLLVPGAALTAWSALHFLKVRGTPVPLNPPPRVVRTGPYRYARNPMVTGVFLILLGIGFGLRSFSLVFVFTPLYVLLNFWELRHIEEPELERRLGEDYRRYREETPMFLPWRRPGRKTSR